MYDILCVVKEDMLMVKRKNPMAVALGRRGGKARLKKMTPEERKRVAQAGANARWKKKKEQSQPS